MTLGLWSYLCSSIQLHFSFISFPAYSSIVHCLLRPHSTSTSSHSKAFYFCFRLLQTVLCFMNVNNHKETSFFFHECEWRSIFQPFVLQWIVKESSEQLGSRVITIKKISCHQDIYQTKRYTSINIHRFYITIVHADAHLLILNAAEPSSLDYSIQKLNCKGRTDIRQWDTIVNIFFIRPSVKWEGGLESGAGQEVFIFLRPGLTFFKGVIQGLSRK